MADTASRLHTNGLAASHHTHWRAELLAAAAEQPPSPLLYRKPGGPPPIMDSGRPMVLPMPPPPLRPEPFKLMRSKARLHCTGLGRWGGRGADQVRHRQTNLEVALHGVGRRGGQGA